MRDSHGWCQLRVNVEVLLQQRLTRNQIDLSLAVCPQFGTPGTVISGRIQCIADSITFASFGLVNSTPLRRFSAFPRGVTMQVRRRGATLIELTIAATIISILTGITLLRAGRFLDSIAVRGAVTEIQSMFSLARHVAISRGAQSTLLIDESAGAITIQSGSEIVRTREVGAAHRVTLSTNRNSITYSPIGVGYGAANFSLVVSRGAVADTIVVSRLGRVRH